MIEGARVEAEIVRHDRDRKVLVYKKKRRKGYEKKIGHRQHYTELKIKKINA
jgi:large subunit ribosomal protein L21